MFVVEWSVMCPPGKVGSLDVIFLSFQFMLRSLRGNNCDRVDQSMNIFFPFYGNTLDLNNNIRRGAMFPHKKKKRCFQMPNYN